MASDFILVWKDGVSTVLSRDAFFHGNEKPALSFSFDTLNCETPTGVYFRTAGGNQFLLSEEQVEECRAYCENFYENGDYSVFAYDPERGNLYRGVMKKSACEEKGYRWVVDVTPESDAAAWDEEGDAGVVYYAALLEDGSPRVAIDRVCDLCVRLFTREEWDAFPAQPHPTDKWDFEKDAWVDKRDLAQVKKEALLAVRNNFEALRWKAAGEYVPAYERETWRVQVAEAEAWLEDGNASTPYIDAFLSARTDSDVPSKEDLIADILDNNERFTVAMAKASAEMWAWKKRISEAEDGYAVDAIVAEFNEFFAEACK